VNGIDRMLLVGAERFSANAAITGLDAGRNKQRQPERFPPMPLSSVNGAIS